MVRVSFSEIQEHSKDYLNKLVSGLNPSSSEYQEALFKFEDYCWQEYHRISASKKLQEEIKEELSEQRVKKRFMMLFNQRSFKNETVGEMLFYILISLFSKNIKLFNNAGARIRMNQHLFFIQNSRTGKDQAFKFVLELIDAYNKKATKSGLNLVSYYKLDGHETVESMIDHFVVEKGKLNTSKINRGLLSRYDLLVSLEASVYLLERRGEKQTRSETLLQAMEGTEINKGLSGWGEHTTKTKSNCCLIAASRPIERMKDHIVNSGLQQRALNYMREISNEERKEMVQAVSQSLFSDSNINFTENFNLLVDELLKISAFCESAQIHIKQEKLIQDLTDKKSNEFFDYISDEIGKPEHRSILESFVANFNNKAFSIAVNNAIAHNRQDVRLVDFEIAYHILTKEFEQLVNWVEERIEEDQHITSRRNSLEKQVEKLAKAPIKKSVLAQAIRRMLKCSAPTAYKKIDQMSKGKNSLLKFDQINKVYNLR